MKKWKTYQIVLLAVFCIALNLVGRLLAQYLQLPLWLDAQGTVLYACMGGPICGAMIGLTSNILYGHIRELSYIYALTNMAIGIIVGLAAKKKWMDRFYGAMQTAALVTAVATAVSLPINWLFNEGMTGNVWGDAIVQYFQSLNWPFLLCTAVAQVLLEFSDKFLLITAAFLLLKFIKYLTEQDDLRPGAGKTAAGAMVLCILLGAAAQTAFPGYASAEDYNDYVQTEYSGNSGLPCGQANDIAQTHDGVLWIGTYAGLYRYNGRDFKWIDHYDSVRNVNCLYVDEEGRLWIGTNDNGLSIAIHENIVNVIDQDSGLSSNSVRSIVQASDGYYYVGTTSSLQIMQLSNGLEIVNTLREINYAECSTVDSEGHVAVLTSDGRLFLIRSGRILSSIRLTEGEEEFSCCAFAPDGTLLAGTSTNHIYRYDISSGGFVWTGTTTLDEVSCLYNLHYLDNGTLILTALTGIAYILPDQTCQLLNSNTFNNSIHHVLEDYQGNLWFTSTRLGLLRLTRSSFKDVYGTIGMERCVVNAVTHWNGSYCIGTDNGLDVIDSACRKQIRNELTSGLEGQRIRCVLTDSRDHLWVCSYGGGLYEASCDGQVWTYTEQEGLFGNRTRLVTELSDGTILAAGDTGISYIRDHSVARTIRNRDGLINSLILTLTEMPDGSILAGTDGDGIAVLRHEAVERFITHKDGLTSGVILRTIRDPESGGVMIVTSNGLCYLQEDGTVRPIRHFPYYNCYDIRPCREHDLMVMSSAGIYIVSRDDLVNDTVSMPYELLNSRSGLTTALTANSWNYVNASGELFLPCDTGVYIFDTNKYNQVTHTYRMNLAGLVFDGRSQLIPRNDTITIRQGIDRVELSPEILNYTIQDPNVGYFLEGYDAQWTILPHSKLNTISYTNLPAGEYVIHLAVFDSTGEKIIEEQQMRIIKEGELYETVAFRVYLIILLLAFVVCLTWMIVERQLVKQKLKIDMANETVMAIANAVDAKDVRTSQHSRRVAEYSVLIAREMNCFPRFQRKKKLENLREAAQMHDIGKIGIHDNVLNKVGRLTDEEYAEMKSHVNQGAVILKDFTLVEHVVDGTRYHHERYDGRGYPDGLKGEEIPLYGRIIAVADAFDAMTSNRVYRKQMDTDYVMNEMVRGRGTQFDPNVLDAFLRLVDKGIINLEQIYAEKAAEIVDADQKNKEALEKRAEEDRKIQADAMKAQTAGSAPGQPDGKGAPA